MSDWFRKLKGWLRRDLVEAELREEMRVHLEMKAEATGDPNAARRGFGNEALLLEDARAAWGWPRLEDWLRDFRLGLRLLVRCPAFAATVVLTLALGIGASSTVFSLIDTVLLRPLPYPEPDRLTAVSETKLSDLLTRTPVAPGRLEDWQRLTKAFEALAGSRTDTLNDTTGAEPERLDGAVVSPRFFAVLKTPAQLGRTFLAEEERFGGPPAAVISDGLWRRRFGGDAGVLGRTLELSGGRVTIVGVMPADFAYPAAATAIWIPERTSAEGLEHREARYFQAIGRIRAGVTTEQARADLAAVQGMLAERYPKTDAGWSVAVKPLKEEVTGSVSLALWMLFGSVGLLLLIACANVACLMLVRYSGRSTEIAMRLALGARRSAIARQFLAEGLVYALAGGLLGLGAAAAGVSVLRNRLTGIPRIGDLAVDGSLAAFVFGVSVLTAVLFSLAPVLQAFRRDPARLTIRGGRGVAAGPQRLARVLVAGQLALATTLLVGAGLFLRSLISMQQTPLGFRTEDVLALRVSASSNEVPGSTISRHQRTLDAVTAIPGVRSAAMSSGLPGVNGTWPREFEIVGEATPNGTLQFARWRIVTDGYFETLGIPVTSGSTCRMNADPAQAYEALVNRSFVDRFLKGRDAVGRFVQGGPIGRSSPQIVGVVADVKEDGAGKDTAPVIYACGYLRYWPDSDILVRAAGNPAGMTHAVRQAVRGVEPSRPIYAVRTLAQATEGTLAQERFRAVLVGLFSALALLLAAIGLYGVMAYVVAMRTKEIGLRVALGARPGQILGEILKSGGRLAMAGVITGIALAVMASRLAGALVYGVGSLDAASYLGAAGVLASAALLACLIPARRATAIDPVQALRE